ncbi:unnamed protein product, partial [Darwinula stevensoni]
YIHGSKIGVLVDVVGGDDALAKDIAMHIAAAKPKSLDASGIAPELIEAERRVAIEKAKEAGKPEAMLEKIADDASVASFTMFTVGEGIEKAVVDYAAEVAAAAKV